MKTLNVAVGLWWEYDSGDMPRNLTTEKVIDEIIKISVTGAVFATGMVLPNALIALDRPLKHLYDRMDSRERWRESRRIIYYMKSQGYLAGEYQHGLQLTDKARKRYQNWTTSEIVPTQKWDHLWRVVVYDIPEQRKSARNHLNQSLREIGCFQLQRSTWITPFACRELVEQISSNYQVDDYVSYFEVLSLDNAQTMIGYFKKKYPQTNFH